MESLGRAGIAALGPRRIPSHLVLKHSNGMIAMPRFRIIYLQCQHTIQRSYNRPRNLQCTIRSNFRNASSSTGSSKQDVPSHGKDSSRQQPRALSSHTEKQNSQVDDLLKNIELKRPAPRRSSAADPGRQLLEQVSAAHGRYSSRSSMGPRGGQNMPAGGLASAMDFASVESGGAKAKARVNRPEITDYRLRKPPQRRTIRSRPKVGRAIELDTERGFDFARALKRMNSLLSQNRVKSDKRKQRFHERPGLKRKRLKSERWRTFFMKGFKATISRVQELRRAGW